MTVSPSCKTEPASDSGPGPAVTVFLVPKKLNPAFKLPGSDPFAPALMVLPPPPALTAAFRLLPGPPADSLLPPLSTLRAKFRLLPGPPESLIAAAGNVPTP